MRFRIIKILEFGFLDQKLLKIKVNQTKETASLQIRLVPNIRPTTFLTFHISALIKLVAIHVIIYRSIYKINSNYIPLFIIIYFYSVSF